MSRVLLIEDDELVGTMVRINLTSDGHELRWETDGAAGLQAALAEPWDLVLLDISLPRLDGIRLLEQLRRRGSGTPVLMLTARSDVLTKVQTLDLGADDYLSKPFDVNELIARVRALVRRSRAEREPPADRRLRVGDWDVRLDTRHMTAPGRQTTLSEKEAAILELLARAGGQPVSRADILEEVWGMDAYPTERTVDNYLLRLRKLFEPEPEQPRHILTVWGVGYRLVP